MKKIDTLRFFKKISLLKKVMLLFILSFNLTYAQTNLHSVPVCDAQADVGEVDWTRWSPNNSNEFTWNAGALSKTLTNISNTNIDLNVVFSGDTSSLSSWWCGNQSPVVDIDSGEEGLQYLTTGFSNGINIALNFSEPVNAVGFDLAHINYQDGAGDKYTITAITASGNTIYPTFTAANNAAYVTDSYGNVDAIAWNYCTNREVGVNFASLEKIVSINLYWQNCESCCDGMTHGSAIWNIDFCKSLPTIDVVDDNSSTLEDTPVIVSIYDNDNDIPTSGTLVLTNPTNGTVTVDNNGTPNDPSDDVITYTPNPNFNGTDTFDYTICNNVVPQNCETATVTVIVTPVVDVTDDESTTEQNTPININIYSNDNDIPTNGTLTITDPTNGIVTVDNNGTPNDPSDDIIIYTPNTNFTGVDTFEYTVCNNTIPQICRMAIVTINILGFQDFAPVIFLGNSVVIGSSGNIDFRVLIGEYGNGNSNGVTPVELRIVKNTELVVSFDNTLTSLSGQPVSNNQWRYDGSHPALHKFIYIGNGGIFLANTAKIIGITATYFPPVNSNGTFPLKATVKFFSGGETNNFNNNDIDFIEFHNN